MTDYAKLAAELETPLQYEAEVWHQLLPLSFSSFMGQGQGHTTLADRLANASTVLQNSFRMARDPSISSQQAAELFHKLTKITNTSLVEDSFLPGMYRLEAALKGHRYGLVQFIQNDGFYSCTGGYAHPSITPVGTLILARMIGLQKQYGSSDEYEASRGRLSKYLHVYTDTHFVLTTTEEGSPASEGALSRLFTEATTRIPDDKLHSVAMGHLFTGITLVDEQLRFLRRLEEEQVRVLNGTSMLLDKQHNSTECSPFAPPP